MTPSRIGAGLVLVLLLAPSCRGDVAAGPAEPRALSTRRFVEAGTVPSADARLEHGTYEVLAGVARPVLRAAKPFAPRVSCDAASCEVALPGDLPDAPVTILAWPPEHDDGRKGGPGEAAPTTPQQPAARVVDGSAPAHAVAELPPGEASHAVLYRVPPLAARDVVTEPFVVPPGAVLALSVGVEEAAWRIDSAPVYLRVVVLDDSGLEQDLFRRVLDPARRVGDRRWLDAEVDLTDLVGRKVWLRFTSAPSEPGDERASLPLWGDPRLLSRGGQGAGGPSIVLVSLEPPAGSASGAAASLAARGARFRDVAGGDLLGEATDLAGRLRRAGYATAAFVEGGGLAPGDDAYRGFSTYDAVADGVGETFGAALEWAGRNANQRFFVFVHADATLAQADATLGRLVAGLELVVPSRELLIVVAANPGRGREGERPSLVMVWQDEIRPRDVSDRVSLDDVVPTIADLAGAATERRAGGGRSLVPLLTGGGASDSSGRDGR